MQWVTGSLLAEKPFNRRHQNANGYMREKTVVDPVAGEPDNKIGIPAKVVHGWPVCLAGRWWDQ